MVNIEATRFCLSIFIFSIHTVFGHVISGHDIVRDVENQKVNDNHKPYADVRISHCGELVKKSKAQAKKAEKKKSKTFQLAFTCSKSTMETP